MLNRQKINQVQQFLDESKCTPAEVVLILREQARVQRNKIQTQLENALKKIEQAGFIDKGWSIEEAFGEGWLRVNLLKPVFQQVGQTVMFVPLYAEVPDYTIRLKQSQETHSFDDLQTQYPLFKPLCKAMREWILFTHSTRLEYPSRCGSIVVPLLRLMSDDYSFPMNQ